MSNLFVKVVRLSRMSLGAVRWTVRRPTKQIDKKSFPASRARRQLKGIFYRFAVEFPP